MPKIQIQIMNFLAHAFLSGNNEKVLLGNFMGDFIKGRQYNNYDSDIGKGVLLHREIDHFTDINEIVSLSKSRLRESVSHYAGVVVDIFYDHFLISQWEYFSTQKINKFVEHIYSTIKKHADILPPAGRYMIPYMIEQNWLINYGNMEGLRRSLKGISRRSRFNPPLLKTMMVLEKDYQLFAKEFRQFFPQLIYHVNLTKAKLDIEDS